MPSEGRARQVMLYTSVVAPRSMAHIQCFDLRAMIHLSATRVDQSQRGSVSQRGVAPLRDDARLGQAEVGRGRKGHEDRDGREGLLGEGHQRDGGALGVANHASLPRDVRRVRANRSQQMMHMVRLVRDVRCAAASLTWGSPVTATT
jgi:hypothetical protein